MHHVSGHCAPFGRCPWTDVVVHAPRPRCRTSGKGVRFQRSGCRTANGQGVGFGRHIQLSAVSSYPNGKDPRRAPLRARFAASAPSGHRRAGKTDPDRAVLPAGRPPLSSNRKGHSTLARFGLPATPETLPAPAKILSQPERPVHRLPMRSFFAIASTWLLSDLCNVNRPFSKG